MTQDHAPDMDDDLLLELRDVMGPDFGMLVDSWCRDTATRIEGIGGAIAAGDAAALRQLAHSLKGSSANLGARDVVATCLRLEELGATGDTRPAEPLLASLSGEFEKAASFLRRFAGRT